MRTMSPVSDTSGRSPSRKLVGGDGGSFDPEFVFFFFSLLLLLPYTLYVRTYILVYTRLIHNQTRSVCSGGTGRQHPIPDDQRRYTPVGVFCPPSRVSSAWTRGSKTLKVGRADGEEADRPVYSKANTFVS